MTTVYPPNPMATPSRRQVFMTLLNLGLLLGIPNGVFPFPHLNISDMTTRNKALLPLFGNSCDTVQHLLRSLFVFGFALHPLLITYFPLGVLMR